MANSTSCKSRVKPQKPYDGFPLFAHASGQWSKKINRRLHYFGVWSDPEAALERLNFEYPYLKEGRTPPACDISNGCSLRVLANEFLKSKESKIKAGDLSQRTFTDYHRSLHNLLNYFGKERLVSDLGPTDFGRYRAAISKRLGPSSLKVEITRVKVILKFAVDNQLVDTPIHYGQSFEKPSAKSLRKIRNDAGPKLFTREEIHALLDAADPVMSCMILLGVNCGFGNTDIANLPIKAVDRDTGWIDYPRPKTEVPRRIPIWPETIKAINKAIALRPSPSDSRGNGLCFLTRAGLPWIRTETTDGPEKARYLDALCSKFLRLLKRLGINGRKGLGLYTLRRNFETYAGESKDQVAVDSIMGHVDGSMAGVYRQKISDERLIAVVDTVRQWLFGDSLAEAFEAVDGDIQLEGGAE